MAKIDIKTTITAPPDINIPLVRADQHATANIFRLFFEFFLTFFSGTIGAVLTMTQPPTVYWVMLSILGISALACGVCAFNYGKSSRKKS